MVVAILLMYVWWWLVSSIRCCIKSNSKFINDITHIISISMMVISTENKSPFSGEKQKLSQEDNIKRKMLRSFSLKWFKLRIFSISVFYIYKFSPKSDDKFPSGVTEIWEKVSFVFQNFIKFFFFLYFGFFPDVHTSSIIDKFFH